MSHEKDMVIERLREIQGEIDGLVNEADRLIQMEGSEMAHARAKSYWIAHILGALTGRGSMVTAEDTINEMEEEVASERPQ
jgi:DNA-binding FrmR family transcriptional regulator